MEQRTESRENNHRCRTTKQSIRIASKNLREGIMLLLWDINLSWAQEGVVSILKQTATEKKKQTKH